MSKAIPRTHGLLTLLIMSAIFFAIATSPAQTQQPADNDAAQTTDSKPAEKPDENKIPLDGIWPTPKLMKSVLQRWAHQVGDRYELDEDQLAHVEKAVVDRWTGFLAENRKTIQPIFNEFLELRMEVEPPEKGSVIDWAQQAGQVFDTVREELTLATQDVREVLTARQRIKFEIDMLAFGGGLELAKQRLDRYKQGDFEPHEFWTPTATERRKRREQRSRKDKKDSELSTNADELVKETQDQPADQIMAELDLWQTYVAEFILRYELNEGQRTTALSCLRELSQRATSHRNRHRNDIEKLEQRIAENTSEDAVLEKIQNDITKLYGPIDDMFAELKSRLHNIPTARQRKLADSRSDTTTNRAQNQSAKMTPSKTPTTSPTATEKPNSNTNQASPPPP